MTSDIGLIVFHTLLIPVLFVKISFIMSIIIYSKPISLCFSVCLTLLIYHIMFFTFSVHSMDFFSPHRCGFVFVFFLLHFIKLAEAVYTLDKVIPNIYLQECRQFCNFFCTILFQKVLSHLMFFLDSKTSNIFSRPSVCD